MNDPMMQYPSSPMPEMLPGMSSAVMPQGPVCPMCGQAYPLPNNMPPTGQMMPPLQGAPPGEDGALLAAMMGGMR